jgi:putative membrane protein
MGQLKEAGVDTAVNYGEMYAMIQAGSERAHDGAMAFGAPEGAQGLTAYSFVIKGNDGESSRNWIRTGAAALVLAASGGVLFLRRQLV